MTNRQINILKIVDIEIQTIVDKISDEFPDETQMPISIICGLMNDAAEHIEEILRQAKNL